MTALYSLVRYVEDLDRDEPINVGVLVWADGQLLRKFVDQREGVSDFEVVRRFDELLGYLVEHDDRGGTDAGDRNEPFLFPLSRRRFPHFEITAPRQFNGDEPPEAVLDRLVGDLVEEPSSKRFAVGSWRH
jgi:Protein of unknown function (DUF3037)